MAIPARGLDEIAFWAGQKLATYQVSSDVSCIYFALTSTHVYFGGKLVSKGSYSSAWTDKVLLPPVAADRLGSIKKFYPYGTERPSASANDTEKFTGYFRDASTGLDYADQRYHQPGVGRFMTPDPESDSAKANNPGSWNRYAYVAGEPVNNTDSTGMMPTVNCDPCGDGGGDSPLYIVDGIATNSDVANSMLNSGFATQCPNNFCSGFGSDGYGTTVVQFQAAAGTGPQGYVGLSDTEVTPTRAELVAQQVTRSFDLACQNATNPCDPNTSQTVSVRLEGTEYNVQIPGNLLNVNQASQTGIQDPVSFVHNGNTSFYIGSLASMFGVDVPHVVNLLGGVEGHFDNFGPFNPLHWLLDWAPSLVLNPQPGVQSTWSCSVAGGCVIVP